MRRTTPVQFLLSVLTLSMALSTVEFASAQTQAPRSGAPAISSPSAPVVPAAVTIPPAPRPNDPPKPKQPGMHRA